jgi:UDPglucose 6-dehydrogenase
MMSEVRRKPPKVKVGIIGYGFVGQAIDYAFSTPMVEKMVLDPKYNNNTMNDLADWQPNITFVCLPTPSADDGSIDASLVEETVKKLISSSESFIVIKSTVTPDIVAELCALDSRIAYVPEFLSEGNAKTDIVNSQFMVLGVTEQGAGEYVSQIYANCSICNPAQPITVTPVEASLIKYSINNFLAMKLTFFNQLYDLVQSYGGNYQAVLRGLLADYRVGLSHTKIPGPDGKRGFGGACLPKDLDALIKFAEKETDVDLELLKSVKSVNNKIRSQYETNEREKANNIKFDNE